MQSILIRKLLLIVLFTLLYDLQTFIFVSRTVSCVFHVYAWGLTVEYTCKCNHLHNHILPLLSHQAILWESYMMSKRGT